MTESDFVYRKVSEKEKEDIQREAKAIMDSFSKKLSRIGKDLKEAVVERPEGEREEGKGKECFIDRKIMFENAPNKNDDFIVAEKGSWK